MLKRTIALLLCIFMLLPTLPVFAAEDFAMRHIAFTASTNGTTLNGVPTLQFLFYPDSALQERLDVPNVGVGVTDVYDDRMTVSFTLIFADSPTNAKVAEIKKSYDKITVTNAPASPDSKMLADGRFALRVKPEDMQANSPELTEWAKTHPNWMKEINSYADKTCYKETTDILAHYDRDGITKEAVLDCTDCETYTEQIILTTDSGFSLTDSSKWTLSNTWPGYNGSIPTYYGNTEGEYVQYKPHNLEEGWYDVYFWNMKCMTQQDPVKMTATIYANGLTYSTIPLAVTTATVDKEGSWTKIGTFYFKGTNDEYMRLVSNGGTNARPADAKFVKNDNYQPPEKVTFSHITTTSMGFTKSGVWKPATFADSTGNTTSGASYYGENIGAYTQYMPYNLEPGWYDISFWNLKYQDHQDPMKMTGTVYSNGKLTEKIALDVSTATVDRTGAWTKVGTYYFDGSDTEYFRLVSTYEGTTSRPADVKFEKNNSYVEKVTEAHITTSSPEFSTYGTWLASTLQDSTGNVASGASYYCATKGHYGQYTPQNLVPGYYDIYFWNLAYQDHQNPMKMTGTVYANGVTKENIALETNTISADRNGIWSKVGTYYFSGSNDEYFRLVAMGGTNSKIADVKFIRNDEFSAENKVTQDHVLTSDKNFYKSANWIDSTMADSTGNTDTGVSYYGYTAGDYVTYYPENLSPGYYDVYFWNLKYDDHQDPMKMKGAVFANGKQTNDIVLPVSTATVNREGAWTKAGTYYFKGTGEEYFRLICTGGSNARPADAKFVKNADYVPPSTLSSKPVTITEENGVWTAYGADGEYTLTVDVNTANDHGELSLIVNDTLVDKQYSAFENIGTYTFGTYTFNVDDVIELKYSSYTPDNTAPIGNICYAPAANQYVKYELINNQREEASYFFEAGSHTIKATVTNNTGSAKTYQLFATLTAEEPFSNRPDGNITYYRAMKKLDTSDKITVESGETKVLEATLPIEQIDASSIVKAFVWNETALMVPEFHDKVYTPKTDVQAGTFTITADSCQDLGSWTIVSTSEALTGTVFSGTTHNIPANTKPAVSTFTAVPGEYRIWVRAKNFTDRPELRHFNIEVNGTELTKTFAQVGIDGYYWEDAGTVMLDGKTTVKILDTSAQYAKCDAILFTNKLDAEPPASSAELNASAPIIKTFKTEMKEENMMADFHLDQNFEGGNYKLNYRGNDVIEISPDLRDTRGTWFYWNFKATSDTDRTVTFKLSGCDVLIGNSGVLYSTDEGESWNYMSETAKGTEFSYDFEAGKTVWFTCVMPYQLSDLNNYLDKIKDKKNVEISTLCESEEGREVPLIVVGDKSAEKAVFFTARHHSCESTASYMLEGIVDYLISVSDTSPIFDDYCFYIVPMVDIDGVVNGDQGKERMPHDHNRDYVDGLYAPVRGVKALAETLDVEFAMDIHCPYLQDYGPYFSYSTDVEDAVLKLHNMLIAASTADTTPNKILYEDGWNRPDPATSNAQMKGWFNRIAGASFAATFEIPYSGDVGDEYTPERMISFGELTADTILDYLSE